MKLFVQCLSAGLLLTGGLVSAQEWKSGVEWQQPPVVTPGPTDDLPPSDATVLFDGSNLDAWEGGDKWLIQDGVAIPQEGEIRTRQTFGDIQLHVEWSAPTEIHGSGQGRGNSGIFLMGMYEIQVLDSYHNETYFDGQAASIYKQTPPMANAMRKPGEWNTYEIFFTAPKFRTNGDVETPAYVTVLHNGVLALNHFEIMGPTNYVQAPQYVPHAETGPISLQFHGDPVKFRNIWVRELKPAVGRRTQAPFNIMPTLVPMEEPEAAAANEIAKDSDDKEVEEETSEEPEADNESPDDNADQENVDQESAA